MLVSKSNALRKNDMKIDNIDFIYMKSKNVTNGINLLTSTLFSLIIGGDAFGFRLNLIAKKKTNCNNKSSLTLILKGEASKNYYTLTICIAQHLRALCK